jgi:hypothetical protein
MSVPRKNARPTCEASGVGPKSGEPLLAARQALARAKPESIEFVTIRCRIVTPFAAASTLFCCHLGVENDDTNGDRRGQLELTSF